MSSVAAWVRRHPILGFFVVFAIFPWVVPYKSLAAQVLIYGLFALGFNLLYGYTGLLSFGSAAYWGLGAYGTGIALAKLKVTSLWLALGMGLGFALVGGAVVGFFCLRRRGIYFAMLTLAFAQLLSFAFYAVFCGLAGALDALRLTVVPIESLHWSTSGQVVIMTLLGGAGTFFGPFVGAATFLVLEDAISVWTESWPLAIGAIFLAFRLFLPKGICGTLTGGFHGR